MNKKFIIIIILLTINSILFVIDNISKDKITSISSSTDSTVTENLLLDIKEIEKKIITKRKTIYEKIDSVLVSEFSFSKRWIRNYNTDTLYTKRVKVPAYLPLYKYNQIFTGILNNLNIEIKNISELELSNTLIIKCKINKKLTKIIIRTNNSLKNKIKLSPKFVIIIDDFGNQWGPEYIQGFIDFPVPITLAIIPGHWASKRTADKAFEKGKETIIHMPMEPKKGSIKTEAIKITKEMNEDEITSNLALALEEIPHAKGLNNHEGSLGTSNKLLMTKFFKIFKQKNLYFIDSKTNSKSVCEEVIRSENLISKKNKNILFNKRDIFLDSDKDPEKIEKMFDQAVNSFINEGKDVIVIGHCRKNTITVLEKMVTEKYPELDYSFASELVK